MNNMLRTINILGVTAVAADKPIDWIWWVGLMVALATAIIQFKNQNPKK